ncbi:MAG: DUF2892 domain-containing protein [Weeksellaceae bacterium]|jgi:tetratricopeptide (TPR) repeat protein|nr:DUF2892 domain-containing protein [Weeksellaceae bacterium]
MNKYIKLVITVLMIGFGIYLFGQREYGWGTVIILMSGIPVLLFFRNEFILLAFWFMRKQEIEKAKKWLDKIKNPETQLVRKQFGYYHYMLGITEAQSNINNSEKHMKKALDYGLSYKHDRAMAKMSLAGAAMAKGRKQEAEKLLKEAKALDTQGMFAEQLKMMEQQLKKVNIGRNLQNPNMRKRGKFF